MGVSSIDTDVGAGVMTVPLGVIWVLSALRYFIVSFVFSLSTFGLFSNSNDGWWARVVNSSDVTMAMSDLGRVMGEALGKDKAAAAVVSPSLGEQDGHPAVSAWAKNVVLLFSEEPLAVGLTKPYLCRRRTGVL